MSKEIKNKYNPLDRFIDFISPKWGYGRKAWRNGSRNYDSGSSGRLRQNWGPTNQTGEVTNQFQRDKIRARARDLERNADVGEAIIGAYTRNVIGTGMTLQARATDPKTGKELIDLNKEIEKQFKRWCKAKNCDITGQQSFQEIEEMIMRRILVDGGILIIKAYTKGGVVPFTMQVREVDEIATSLNSFAVGPGQNRIINGIELDNFNKPVAYWLQDIKPDGFTNIKPVRIDAKQVIYLRKKTRPSEVREISQLARTANRISDINEFVEAVSIKERILACLSIFIKKAAPGGFGVGRPTDQVDEETGLTETTLAPGLIQYLQPGEEVNVVNPNGQAANSKEFVTTQVRLAGSGQGISYEMASRDMSMVNYSSARQGLLEDQKTFEPWQYFLIEHFHSEVYTEFVISGWLSGLFNIPDFYNYKEEYLNHLWIPCGWSWIDPNKEIMAQQKALDSNITTLQQICAERGYSWEEILRQRAKEKTLEKELLGESINEEIKPQKKPA